MWVGTFYKGDQDSEQTRYLSGGTLSDRPCEGKIQASDLQDGTVSDRPLLKAEGKAPACARNLKADTYKFLIP